MVDFFYIDFWLIFWYWFLIDLSRQIRQFFKTFQSISQDWIFVIDFSSTFWDRILVNFLRSVFCGFLETEVLVAKYLVEKGFFRIFWILLNTEICYEGIKKFHQSACKTVLVTTALTGSVILEIQPIRRSMVLWENENQAYNVGYLILCRLQIPSTSTNFRW